MGESTDSARTTTALYVVVVVVAVLIGTVFAPVAWGMASQVTSSEQSEVAVITLSGSIAPTTADPVIEDLREARQNDSVEAVVLKIDSPGGAASTSEQLYLAVNRTAQEMPVVASVTGTSASGAYYAMAPADRIYVTPASVVGSVGAFASIPATPDQVPGNIVRSGPDKATQTADQVKNQLETIQRSFVNTIMRHRGDDLEITRNQLQHAKVYTGAKAVQNGVADRIGGVNTAVDYAAQEAGLGDEYGVTYKESATQGLGIILSEEGDGRVVISDEDLFGYEDVQTVQYYALWGLPDTDDGEVVVNATG